MKHLFSIHRLWYFIWFVALPLVLAWIIVDRLDRMRLVDEFEPWYVLLIFALLVMALYNFKDKLPLWQDKNQDSAYNRYKRKKQALSLKKRVSKIVKKNPEKIPEKGRDSIKNCISTLDKSINNQDYDLIDSQTKELEALAKKNLTFVKKGLFREYFESIGIAILIAMCLRLFAVEAFKIPSESMVPTLMVGDHIFVAKYSYGLSVPFKNKMFVRFGQPQYGDVIVFAKPSTKEQGLSQTSYMGDFDEEHLVGTDFIKRVIGLAGDKVEIRDSVIYVNGKAVPRCQVGDTTYKSREGFSENWIDRKGDLWVEKHGSNHYSIVEDYLFDDFEEITVPEGHVFVLGDNRDRSSDSRMWGTVPFDNIKGKAMFIWWSNQRPHGFAWERFGIRIMGAPQLTKAHKDNLAKCSIGLNK